MFQKLLIRNQIPVVEKTTGVLKKKVFLNFFQKFI